MCVFFREEGGGGWEMLGLCVWIGSTFIEMLIDESKTPTCVPADIEMKSLENITFLIEHIKYTYFAICKAHQIFCRFQHWTTLSLWISILNLSGNCLMQRAYIITSCFSFIAVGQCSTLWPSILPKEIIHSQLLDSQEIDMSNLIGNLSQQ